MSRPTKEHLRFVAYLCRLAGVPVKRPEGEPPRRMERNRAALAILRRGLSRRGGPALEMYRYVAPFVPAGADTWEEEAYYLIASLFAGHEGHWEPEDRDRVISNFGVSYAWLIDQERQRMGREPVSLHQRFEALLSSRRKELPVHLRHAISLLKAKEIRVDWVQLLSDLCHWESQSREVQRSWARAVWGRTETKEREESEDVG